MKTRNSSGPVTRSASERDVLNKTDIANRVSKSSKMKYKSGVNRFIKYCVDRNLEPVPTESNLSHFISEVSREIQPKSVNTYLSGISYHFNHSYPEVNINRLSAKVRDTMKGCQKSFSKPTVRANAMELRDLEIAADFFKNTFDDLLFNTILTIGFYGLHRLGELVESDREELKDDRRLIKRWSLKILGVEEFASYSLPCSKTDTAFAGTLVIIPAKPKQKVCPLQTLMRYVVIRDTAFPVNPFLLVRANGFIPSRNWFMKRLYQVFGCERSGHSLRSGGATAYAQAGVRMEVIQQMGRWKSDAFETYIPGHLLLNLLAAQQEIDSWKGSSMASGSSSSCLIGKLISSGSQIRSRNRTS